MPCSASPRRPADRGQRVAHHDTTGRGRELLGIVAVDEGYIAVEQLGAHGGINIAVRTRDRKPDSRASNAKPPINVPQIPRM